MEIKFANDIIKEIKERKPINIPDGYVTGESYEKWLYEETKANSKNVSSVNASKQM